jgi:hypothetical protein
VTREPALDAQVIQIQINHQGTMIVSAAGS